jgi:UDP-N-acetylmuramate--alanine ligase
MFLGLKPVIEVVTNIEYDHPDCYPTPADFQAAFVEFMYHLPLNGTLVACADDPGACDLMENALKVGKVVIPYGIQQTTYNGKPVDVTASALIPSEKGGFKFDASILGKSTTIELQVPGKHNVSNGLAALTVTQLLGLPLPDAAWALAQFTGTGRRFEVRGEMNGIVIVDDYAHHPTEIRATLSAARDRYPSRHIWAVWQPHTYSRTRALFNEFSSAFTDADEVIVTEIYASREPKQNYSSKQVVESMPREAHFIAEMPEVSNYLIKNLRPGDVLLVLSAGNADQISTEVLKRLKETNHG